MAHILHKPERRIVRPLTFSNPPRERIRPLPLFFHRDPMANQLVFGSMAERGRTLGVPILNMPAVPPELLKDGDWWYDEPVRLGPEYEVLCTTRPPLDDQEFAEPKQVVRGKTQIEEDVLTVARKFFKHLSRSQMVLDPTVLNANVSDPQAASALPEGYEHWFNIEYYQRVGARVHHFPSLPKKQRRAKDGPAFLTTGFVLRQPNFTCDGATLLNVFAMDGSAELVWAYLVSRFHTDWLFEDGFRMVAISGPKLPVRASDLSFIDRYEVKDLLYVPA